MEQSKLTKTRIVIVDSREPEIMALRIKGAGLLTEVKKLEAGDYVIGDALVERKEISDFFNTLHSGRLWDQLYNMKLSGMRCFLVIVGNYPSGHKLQITKKQLEQQIKRLSLVAFKSFDVLFTKTETEEQFIEFLKWLYERCNTESYMPMPRKFEKIEDMKIAMLGAVGGIGAKLASELAGKFTLMELMTMDDDALRNYIFSGRKKSFLGN